MPPSALHLVDFMFSTIARKLPPLSLRAEGAAITLPRTTWRMRLRPGGPSAKLLKVWMANSDLGFSLSAPQKSRVPGRQRCWNFWRSSNGLTSSTGT